MNRLAKSSTETLIGDIYDAAIDPGRWGTVFDCLFQEFDAHSGTFILNEKLSDVSPINKAPSDRGA